MKIIWKKINDYYEASNTGLIRSYKRTTSNIKLNTPKIIAQHPSGKENGFYLQVSINSKSTSVHRIIAKLFVENKDNKPQVNHIDGNKYNNHAYNLEWCTHQENQDHAYKKGLMLKARGEKAASKLKEKDVLKIRSLYKSEDMTLKKIAEIYDTHLSTIHLITSRKTWKHI